MNLEIGAIFAPILISDFVDDFWGKNYFYLKGSPEKFSHLLTWSEFNRILQQHRLDFPRLRLAKEGESIPADQYISYSTSRRGVRIPNLDTVNLGKYLREGASLVVDTIDEMHEPITKLSQNLEEVFRESFQVNAYSGWGHSRGFDIHWDDHDVFIFQIFGQKDWKIYGPTREYPLFRDAEFDLKKPEIPIWEETLHAGDILYIPRGWWHVAVAKDEPTLHLTFGFTNRNGIDFTNWIKDQLLNSSIFRKDLPKFGKKDELKNHFKELDSILASFWNEDSIEKFLQEYNSNASPRTKVNLPWQAMNSPFATNDIVRVRINTPRKVKFNFDEKNDTLSFVANGKRWEFASVTQHILTLIMGSEYIQIKEICDQVADYVDSDSVKTFLEELLHNGLLETA